MLVLNYFTLLCYVGTVSLAAAKVFYIYDDNLAPSAEADLDNLQQSYGNNIRIRNLLTKLITRMKQMQSNTASGHIIQQYKEEDDYDYDSYFRDDPQVNTYKQCKGDRCYLLIPGKTPLVIKKVDKDTALGVKEDLISFELNYRSNEINSPIKVDAQTYNTAELSAVAPDSLEQRATDPDKSEEIDAEDEGYERDDEGEISDSEDVQQFEDSFKEQLRSLREKRDKEEEKRIDSMTSIDVADFLETVMRGDKAESENGRDKVRVSKPVSFDYIDPTGNMIPNVFPKNLVKKIRRKPIEYDDDKKYEGARKWGVQKKYKKPVKNAKSSDSDASDSDSNDSEAVYKKRPKAKKETGKKSNRFQVVHDDDSDSENDVTEESNENFHKDTSETIEPVSEEVQPKVTKKKSKPRLPGKPEMYMQSFARLYKEGQDFRKVLDSLLATSYRRRLPTFLPKRYHWDPSEFQKLGYFWFNGPQGKEPGPWRIAY